MRRTLLVLSGLLFTAAIHAYGDDWKKTYQVTGQPELRVATSDANVEVQVWDKNTVDIQVRAQHTTIGSSSLRITEHQDGNVISFEAREHGGFHFSFNQRTDVTIHLPSKANLTVNTGDGRIRVSGVNGNINLHSGDGRQDIDSVAGNLRAHTGDGAIRVRGRFDQLELTTGDGGIEVTVLPGSHIATAWNLQTGDGHMSLELPSDFKATLDMHTNDGHMDLDIPLTVTGRYGQNSVRGDMNGGGNTLRVRTGDGSIRLKRSMAAL
jgi:DUF4097 and DUF4098 domain-containing protein YvlB